MKRHNIKSRGKSGNKEHYHKNPIMMSLKMADVCVKDSIIYLKYCLSDVLYLVLSQILLFPFVVLIGFCPIWLDYIFAYLISYQFFLA